MSSAQLEQLEAEFLQNELTMERIESEFDQKSEEDLYRKKKNSVLCRVLVESHELKERLFQRNVECEDLQKQIDTFRSKAEADKVALITKLGDALDKVNTAETDNEYLMERVNTLEAEVEDYKRRCNELATCSTYFLTSEVGAVKEAYHETEAV